VSTRSLTREVELVKGDKLAIEAARMVEAVNKIGGSSKLTDTELRRLRGTLDEVTQKAKRMGEEVPPSIAKMNAEVSRVRSFSLSAANSFGALGNASSLLTTLLPVASVTGLAAALVSMGKSAFSAASDIADLSNKTGLSMESIQRMQNVANQTGTTLEAFTNAAFKLGVNISDGTEKARKAVSDLGLQYEELRAQSPDQQFAAVVKALEGVESQTERNRMGVALFGRQFGEIAASIQDGYTRIADAAKVSSDAQINALDATGDAWVQFKDDAGKAAQGFLAEAVMALQIGLPRALIEAEIKLAEFGLSLSRVNERIPYMRLFSKQAAESTKFFQDALTHANDTLKGFDLSLQNVGKPKAPIQKIAEETESVTVALRGVSKQAVDSGREMRQMWNDIGVGQRNYAAETMADQAKLIAQVEKLHSDMANRAGLSWEGLHKQQIDASNRLVSTLDLGSMLAPLAKGEGKKAGVNLGAGLLEGVSGSIVKALQGGGNILGSIGSVIGEQLGKNVAEGFGATITKKLGDTFGGLVNTLLPGIGSLLGPLVSKIGGFFKNMFGPGIDLEELRKFNAQIQQVRDGLIQTHGSLEQIEKKANAVGLSFKNEWGHQGEKGLKQFNALIKEFESRIDGLNDGFSELFDELENAGEGLPDQFVPVIQRLLDMGVLSEDLAEQFKSLSEAPSFEQMSKAAEALGVRLESLGPAFDVKKLASDADSFLKNLRILERGGADIGGVLADAAGGINDLVNESIRLEAELPEGLRRFVEELAKSGKLVDANGEALTDLSQLNWAEPMSRSVDRLIDKFQELIDKIINQLGPAIEGIPGVPTGPSGGGNGSPDSIPFGGAQANGGDYVVSRPTMFLAGEAGPERATFTPLGGRGGDTSSIHIPISLDGRLVADVIVDRVGNRLSVRGAR
jgi:hypothetical protein